MQQPQQSDEVIVRYLLGLAREDECEEVETAYLSDEGEWERIEAAEDELIEDYLDGRLELEERHGFEEHFLNSRQRREKLHFARTLREVVTRTSAEKQVVFAKSRARWFTGAFGFTGRQWVSTAALAGALLSCVLLLLQNQRLSKEALLARGERKDLVEQVQTLRQQLDSSNTQLAARLSQPVPPVPVITAALSPGLTRSAGAYARISIPQQAYLAHFKLELLDEDYSSFRAVVQQADGHDILSQSHLRPNSRRELMLVVPAELLGPGDYQILLSGENKDGNYESMASYSFRIVR
jgi:hypothetical protein